MRKIFLRVWQGQDTDWITLTPINPDSNDSTKFDEGECTGFVVSCDKTEDFVNDLTVVLHKYTQMTVKRV